MLKLRLKNGKNAFGGSAETKCIACTKIAMVPDLLTLSFTLEKYRHFKSLGFNTNSKKSQRAYRNTLTFWEIFLFAFFPKVR